MPWQEAGLEWTPWSMSADDLAALPVRRALTARDRERLATLIDTRLPPVLLDLAHWMLEHDEKGEQEAML